MKKISVLVMLGFFASPVFADGHDEPTLKVYAVRSVHSSVLIREDFELIKKERPDLITDEAPIACNPKTGNAHVTEAHAHLTGDRLEDLQALADVACAREEKARGKLDSTCARLVEQAKELGRLPQDPTGQMLTDTAFAICEKRLRKRTPAPECGELAKLREAQSVVVGSRALRLSPFLRARSLWREIAEAHDLSAEAQELSLRAGARCPKANSAQAKPLERSLPFKTLDGAVKLLISGATAR